MKTEFVKVPGKGICILISGFTLEDIYKGIPTTEFSNSNSVFNNVSVIADSLREGKVIAAIKEIRCQTGWGLKEAKEYCDKLFPAIIGYDYGRDRDDYKKAADKFLAMNTAVDFLNIEDVEL